MPPTPLRPLSTESAAGSAERLVERALDLVARKLEESEHRAHATILRGVLHLIRPSGEYLCLIARNWMGDGAAEGAPLSLDLSATTRELLLERGDVLALDVRASTYTLLDDARETRALPGAPRLGERTRQQLSRRRATHVLALRVRFEDPTSLGVLAIEATGGVPGLFIWPDCAQELRALVEERAGRPVSIPAPPARAPDPLLPVVGRAMAPVVEVLRGFARQGDPILLLGPTGVGKTRLASWCHHISGRSGSFVRSSVEAVSADLQMSALFGHTRGAFTGAVRDRPGRFAEADGGTIFLDEVDKLTAEAQAMLLEVLDEGTYRPVGASGPSLRSKARVIAATNANLRARVAEGRFLPDLFFRLNVLPVRVPALDLRHDEIPGWAEHMLGERHGDRGAVDLAGDAVAFLHGHTWPGNLRQLQNILARAYAFAAAEATGPDLLVTGAHVARAFACDEDEDTLPRAIEALAFEAVAAAERGRASGQRFDLAELSQVFEGLVVRAAQRRFNDLDRALEALGAENAVKHRNQQKLVGPKRAAVAAFAARRGLVGPLWRDDDEGT